MNDNDIMQNILIYTKMRLFGADFLASLFWHRFFGSDFLVPKNGPSALRLKYLRGLVEGCQTRGPRDDSNILNKFHFVPQNSISDLRTLKKGDNLLFLFGDRSHHERR